MSTKPAARRRGEPTKPEGIKVTIRIPDDLAGWLAVEAAMRRPRRTRGQIVDELIRPHLSRWRVYRVESGGGETAAPAA